MRLNSIIKSYIAWLDNVWNNYALTSSRSWCTLSLQGLANTDLTLFFDRKDLNDEYSKRYAENDPNKKLPFTYIGTEIDAITTFQKSMVARHKSRLQAYRDDAVQKRFLVKSTIAEAQAGLIQGLTISKYPTN